MTGRNRNSRHGGRNAREKSSAERDGIKSVRATSIQKPVSRSKCLVDSLRKLTCQTISGAMYYVHYVCVLPYRLLLKPVTLAVSGTKCVFYKHIAGTEHAIDDVEMQLEETNIKLSENMSRSQKIAAERKEQRLQKVLRDQKSRHQTELVRLKTGHEQEINVLQRKVHVSDSEIQRLAEVISQKETEFKTFKRSYQAELETYQAELETLYKCKAGLTRELDKERKASEELSNRLSKVMSSQLMDSNPNIADLSDTNRPTKLVEQFSELYDNEWTNAYGVLGNILADEFSVIRFLLGLLEECFRQCRQLAKDQLIMAKSQNRDPQSSDFKSLKDERKKSAHLTLHFINQLVNISLQRNIDSSMFNLLGDSKVQDYIQLCTKLCWLMSVQDPPMAITTAVAPDLQYNRAMYKEYTKSGVFVDYVVWPAVLLHDDGPLMAKGTVQCCDIQQNSNFIKIIKR